MKELEIIDLLILDTKYGDHPYYLSTKEKERKELHNLGFYDDNQLKMTDKGRSLLLEYYEKNKEKVLIELKKAKGKNYNYEELSEVCKLPTESLLLKFILRRLVDEGEISLSASTNWDDRIKYIIHN